MEGENAEGSEGLRREEGKREGAGLDRRHLVLLGMVQRPHRLVGTQALASGRFQILLPPCFLAV